MKNNSNINIIDKKNRLEKAVAYLKGAQIIKNQKDISDTGIVSEESLTRALKGNEKYLTDNFLKKIAAKYGFNSDWLLTGEGSMLKTPPLTPVQQKNILKKLKKLLYP